MFDRILDFFFGLYHDYPKICSLLLFILWSYLFLLVLSSFEEEKLDDKKQANTIIENQKEEIRLLKILIEKENKK